MDLSEWGTLGQSPGTWRPASCVWNTWLFRSVYYGFQERSEYTQKEKEETSQQPTYWSSKTAKEWFRSTSDMWWWNPTIYSLCNYHQFHHRLLQLQCVSLLFVNINIKSFSKRCDAHLFCFSWRRSLALVRARKLVCFATHGFEQETSRIPMSQWKLIIAS